jgi:hypothetical protein
MHTYHLKVPVTAGWVLALLITGIASGVTTLSG